MGSKLVDWKNPPTYDKLKSDRDMADSSHNTFLGQLNEYRTTLDGGPVITVNEGKSSVRPLLTLKHTEWQIPMIEEPFLSTRDLFQIRPRTAEDGPAAEQSQVLLNYYLNVKMGKVSFINEMARTLVREGTVTVKNGWYSREEEVEVEVEKPIYATAEESYQLITRAVETGNLDPATGQAMIETGELLQVDTEVVTETQTKLVENHPTADVIDNESVIVDPTAMGVIANANFIIHEYESDYSTIKLDEYDKETGKGMYKCLPELYKALESGEYKLVTNSIDSGRALADTMRFEDTARKKVTLSEYWGYWDIHGDGKKQPIVATWAAGILIRLEENPYAHGNLPFSKTTYMPVKNEYHGIPDCKLTKENQESVGKMTRAYHDIVSAKATGQTLIQENTFTGPAEWDAYYRGDHARFNPGIDINRAIHTIGADTVDPSIFQVIQMQTNEAETISSVRPFNNSSAGGLGSATAERNSMDAVSKRTLSILRRISSELWQDMARMLLQNTQAYVSAEEVIRITASEHVVVRREDIQGEFDLIVEVSTPEKDAQQAQQLMTLLQSNQANMDLELQKIFYKKLLVLWKHPEEAQMVAEFEPKPNPVQQETEKVLLDNAKLENEMLKMKMAEMMSNIEKNHADVQYKNTVGLREVEADIERKMAQTGELNSRKELLDAQTDLADQEFLDGQSGAKRQRQIEDMQYTEESKAARESARNRTALANPVVTESKTQTNEAKGEK